MSYAIIGFGKIGQALAKAFARNGIEVSVATTRDPESFASDAAAIGPTIIPKKLAEAVKADIVFLAVRYESHPDVAKALPSWEGKTVIDATNLFPVPEELDGLPSSAVVAKAFTGAKLVKGFNHLIAATLAADPVWRAATGPSFCRATGPVAHGQRCQSRLSGALWRPSIARRSPASGTSDNSFFDDAGRKTLWMGISGRRQLRYASVARCATRQQRADLRSRCPRRPWPDSGATLGDWPILGEWSACGDHTRFSSSGARRVPRRSTSEQSVAPSPRIHEMDRRCADAVSGIARRTSSSVYQRTQHEREPEDSF